MRGGEHPLGPQRLKSQHTSSPYSDHINYSGPQWSSNSKGSSLSRSYNNSVRSWHARHWEKDIYNIFHNDKLFLDEYIHDHSDYADNINRVEKDLLQRSQSMNSGSWRETLSPRTRGDVSSHKKNQGKTDGRVTGVIGKINETMLNDEFPLLGAERQHGSSELGRVLSSSSSTNPAVIVSNGLSSASHEIPVTVGNSSVTAMTHHHNVSATTSSIVQGKVGLNMAETLAQGPTRPHTPPQLSVGPQKLEELAIKQSRLLIPITPSTPRSQVASSSKKSKVNTGQLQHPFSYSRSPGHSLHGAHPNSDVQKIISANSHNASALRELNGVSSTANDNLSPKRSILLGPVDSTASTSISAPSRSSSNSPPSVRITLEKRPTFQTQSRSDFLKNLSKKSSAKKPCSDVFPIDMPCALENSEADTSNVISCHTFKSSDASSVNTSKVDTSKVNSLTEYSSIVTHDGHVPSEPLKFSANEAQQYGINRVLYSDKEEIAFLRSLGWEENAGDDEGLTEEEIQDFYQKYSKSQL